MGAFINIMNKNTKKLKRIYRKKLNQINKKLLDDKCAILTFFIEYLKYKRDCTIIASYNISKTTDIKLTSLIAAAAEFEAFESCEEVDKKAFHWNNFCELFKSNMEEWLEINDSI